MLAMPAVKPAVRRGRCYGCNHQSRVQMRVREEIVSWRWYAEFHEALCLPNVLRTMQDSFRGQPVPEANPLSQLQRNGGCRAV